MTPYEHYWAFAKSLKVNEMDEFIEKWKNLTHASITIYFDDVFKDHAVVDVLEAVRFIREEYRKDELMKKKEQ